MNTLPLNHLSISTLDLAAPRLPSEQFIATEKRYEAFTLDVTGFIT
jgi:hypothetical protein